jgi:hypothetical protein
MKHDVQNFVNQCEVFQQAKHQYSHPSSLLQPLPIPKGAWHNISLDSVVKLHGVPKSMVPDKDRIFLSTVWKELFQHLGTKLLHSTTYHP